MVSEMLGKYLEEVRNTRSKPTHETYKFLLNPFDRWLHTKGKTIDNFEAIDLVEYLKAREDLSKYTRTQIQNKVKTYVRHRINQISYGSTPQEMQAAMNAQASLKRILDVRMLSFLRGTEDGVEKKKSLTLEELKMLLDLATPEDKTHIYLLAYFGLRVSEYLGITVDSQNQKIRFKRAKTYRQDSLDFSPYVGGLLGKVDVKRLRAKELNYRFYKYDKLGYRVHPHIFRHTFDTQMRKSLWGKVRDPKYVLKVLCGHSLKSDMTDYYTDVEDFKKECKQAMNEFHYLAGVRV